MRLKAVTLLAIVCALATSTLNLAPRANAQEGETQSQDKSKSGGKPAKKQTKIDFEDELVEGEIKKPELFYLLQKKQFNFKRLIKLREDFLPEMRRDGDEVRRSRSK